MCQEILIQRFLACGHVFEYATGKTTPFCLFGEQCKEVNYGHKIFRRANKLCWDCMGETQNQAGKTWPAPRVPYYAHDKNSAVEGAPARLRSILDGGKLPAKASKDLLFYIAGLPDWMRKGRLVRQFGYDVSGQHGAQFEQDIKLIAQKKHVDKSLEEGMKKKQNEAAKKV